MDITAFLTWRGQISLQAMLCAYSFLSDSQQQKGFIEYDEIHQGLLLGADLSGAEVDAHSSIIYESSVIPIQFTDRPRKMKFQRDGEGIASFIKNIVRTLQRKTLGKFSHSLDNFKRDVDHHFSNYGPMQIQHINSNINNINVINGMSNINNMSNINGINSIGNNNAALLSTGVYNSTLNNINNLSALNNMNTIYNINNMANNMTMNSNMNTINMNTINNMSGNRTLPIDTIKRYGSSVPYPKYPLFPGQGPSCAEVDAALNKDLFETCEQGIRFLAEIRRGGMDILFPQIKHDKVLCIIFAVFTLVKSTAHKELIDLVMAVKECGTVSHLENVSKTKVRGVIALLKLAAVIETHGGSTEKAPVNLTLSLTIDSYETLREQHDEFISNFGATQPVVWRDEIYWGKLIWGRVEDVRRVEKLQEIELSMPSLLASSPMRPILTLAGPSKTGEIFMTKEAALDSTSLYNSFNFKYDLDRDEEKRSTPTNTLSPLMQALQSSPSTSIQSDCNSGVGSIASSNPGSIIVSGISSRSRSDSGIMGSSPVYRPQDTPQAPISGGQKDPRAPAPLGPLGVPGVPPGGGAGGFLFEFDIPNGTPIRAPLHTQKPPGPGTIGSMNVNGSPLFRGINQPGGLDNDALPLPAKNINGAANDMNSGLFRNNSFQGYQTPLTSKDLSDLRGRRPTMHDLGYYHRGAHPAGHPPPQPFPVAPRRHSLGSPPAGMFQSFQTMGSRDREREREPLFGADRGLFIPDRELFIPDEWKRNEFEQHLQKNISKMSQSNHALFSSPVRGISAADDIERDREQRNINLNLNLSAHRRQQAALLEAENNSINHRYFPSQNNDFNEFTNLDSISHIHSQPRLSANERLWAGDDGYELSHESPKTVTNQGPSSFQYPTPAANFDPQYFAYRQQHQTHGQTHQAHGQTHQAHGQQTHLHAQTHLAHGQQSRNHDRFTPIPTHPGPHPSQVRVGGLGSETFQRAISPSDSFHSGSSGKQQLQHQLQQQQQLLHMQGQRLTPPSPVIAMPSFNINLDRDENLLTKQYLLPQQQLQQQLLQQQQHYQPNVHHH